MTTRFDFQPSLAAPFAFQPTLDGQVYNATVTWSLFGRRYYLNITALDGTRVVTEALVGSTTGIALESISWANGKASASAPSPHGYKTGNVIELTISGAVPDAYNGRVPCLITGPRTFSYALAADPGMATVFGTASYDVDLAGGYFESSIVFRQAAQQFEINP